MQHRKQSAFTLLEIMVALGILAILLGIGYPAYVNYLQRGYLSEAKQNISAIVQAEEQFYLENNRYFYDNSNSNAALATASGGLWTVEGDDDGQVNFTYTVVPAGGGGYMVTATGVGGSPTAGMTESETH